MNILKESFRTILVVIILVAGVSIVSAWTGPTATPPGNNTPAPINVSASSQYKDGALGIGGLFRAYSNAIIDGNVGIGIASPTQKLDVVGQIHASGDICTDAGGGKCLSTVTGGGAGGPLRYILADGVSNCSTMCGAGKCVLGLDKDGDNEVFDCTKVFSKTGALGEGIGVCICTQ